MQAAARMASVVSLTLPARRRLIRNVSRCSRPVTTKQKSRKRKCTCNWLHNSAEDPDIPVVFDARLNEFHIQRNRDKGYSMVYFCPICGYAAPDSLRGSLFARIPHKEHRRLDELTQHLKTLDEVFSALGTPTRDEPYGQPIGWPSPCGRLRLARCTSLGVDTEFDEFTPPRSRSLPLFPVVEAHPAPDPFVEFQHRSIGCQTVARPSRSGLFSKPERDALATFTNLR